MEKYILEFVKKNAVLGKNYVRIPWSILAFKLMENAGLEVKDKQELVLSL